MAKAIVRFIRFDGTEVRGEMSVDGESVMTIAKRTGVNGIIAECGGHLSCATCHVYIDRSWLARLPSPTPLESAMLDCTLGQADNSRLSCQIHVSSALDGLVVIVPNSQF